MLRSKKKAPHWIWIIISVVIGIAVLVFCNYMLVDKIGAGKNVQFYLQRYYDLFVNGVSPYSLSSDSLFMQPLFGFVIYLPFVFINNLLLASSFFLAINQIIFFLSIILLVRLISLVIKTKRLLGLLLFSVAILYTFINLIQGQSTLLKFAIIIGICWAIFKNHQELAGILISFLAIDLLGSAHIIVFFLFWSAFNRRGKTFLWFFISLSFLIAIAALIIPDWVLQWLRHMMTFPPDAFGITISKVLTEYWGVVGTRIGNALSILSIALLLVEWWINRRSTNRAFVWVLSLTIILGFWLGIPVNLDLFLYCVLVLILIFTILSERWKIIGNIFSGIVAFVMIMIPWSIFFSDSNPILQKPLENPFHLIFIPIFFLPILFWIRWWCINSPEVWFDLVQKKSLNL